MRVELRIGGKSSPFSTPKNIFIDGNCAYVCNNSTNNITKVNLENYSVEEHCAFEEGVHSFVKSGKYEFVLLDSGLYLL